MILEYFCIALRSGLRFDSGSRARNPSRSAQLGSPFAYTTSCLPRSCSSSVRVAWRETRDSSVCRWSRSSAVWHRTEAAATRIVTTPTTRATLTRALIERPGIALRRTYPATAVPCSAQPYLLVGRLYYSPHCLDRTYAA